LDIAHAASFLMSNSAVASKATSGGMMLASIIAWKKNKPNTYEIADPKLHSVNLNVTIVSVQQNQHKHKRQQGDLVSTKKKYQTITFLMNGSA